MSNLEYYRRQLERQRIICSWLGRIATIPTLDYSPLPINTILRSFGASKNQPLNANSVKFHTICKRGD
jgi:hypothetical protein